MEDLFFIITWKTRHNAHNEITHSRLLVTFQSKYYYIEGKHIDHSGFDHIFNNIIVTQINPEYTPQDIEKYSNAIPGRHNIMLNDPLRTTNQNIELYRVKLSVQEAILSYISGYESKINNIESNASYIRSAETYIDTIYHDTISIYGEGLSNIDTNSSINCSMCSNDTRADILGDCEYDINNVLGISDIIYTDDNYDTIQDIIIQYKTEIYSDTVAFKKALKLYPERERELYNIRVNKWQNSDYYNDIANKLEFGG